MSVPTVASCPPVAGPDRSLEARRGAGLAGRAGAADRQPASKPTTPRDARFLGRSR